MLSELAECTVLMLRVIHEMYSTQRITYEEFLDYSEKKIQFLKENLEYISSETERRDVFDIISKYNALLSNSDEEMAYLQ